MNNINLYNVLDIMLYVILFVIAWGIPVFIIKAVIKAVEKSHKREKDMFDKAHELNEKKYMLENEQYTAQKIVRCEYCDKQTRFGNGTCPHCGAKLIKPRINHNTIKKDHYCQSKQNGLLL